MANEWDFGSWWDGVTKQVGDVVGNAYHAMDDTFFGGDLPEPDDGEKPIWGGIEQSWNEAWNPTDYSDEGHMSRGIRDLPVIGGASRAAEAAINPFIKWSERVVEPFWGAALGANPLVKNWLENERETKPWGPSPEDWGAYLGKGDIGKEAAAGWSAVTGNKEARQKALETNRQTPLAWQLATGFLDPSNFIPGVPVTKLAGIEKAAQMGKNMTKYNLLEQALTHTLGKTKKIANATGDVLDDLLGIRPQSGIQQKIPWGLSREGEVASRLSDSSTHLGNALRDVAPEVAGDAVRAWQKGQDFEGSGEAVGSLFGRRVQRLIDDFDVAKSEQKWALGQDIQRTIGLLEAAVNSGKKLVRDLDPTFRVSSRSNLIRNALSNANGDKTLVEIGKELLKKSEELKLPKSAKEFKSQLITDMVDHMSQRLTQKMLVDPRTGKPLVTSFDRVREYTNKLKRVESMLFLAANPLAFPLTNLAGNVGPETAHGVFGLHNIDTIEKFFQRVGVTPDRLLGGVDIVNDKLVRTRKEINLWNPLHWSQAIEQWSSANAFYKGFNKVFPQYWKLGKGFKRMDPRLEAAIAAVHPELPKSIYAAIEHGYSKKEILEAIFNLPGVKGYGKIPLDKLINDAAQKMGVEASKIVSDHQSLVDQIRKAVADGATPEQIESMFGQLKKQAQDSYDSLLKRSGKINDTVGKLKTSGQAGVSRMIDDLYNDLGKDDTFKVAQGIWEQAKKKKGEDTYNWALYQVNQLWQKYFDDLWEGRDNIYVAFEQEFGKRIPDEIEAAFRSADNSVFTTREWAKKRLAQAQLEAKGFKFGRDRDAIYRKAWEDVNGAWIEQKQRSMESYLGAHDKLHDYILTNMHNVDNVDNLPENIKALRAQYAAKEAEFLTKDKELINGHWQKVNPMKEASLWDEVSNQHDAFTSNRNDWWRGNHAELQRMREAMLPPRPAGKPRSPRPKAGQPAAAPTAPSATPAAGTAVAPAGQKPLIASSGDAVRDISRALQATGGRHDIEVTLADGRVATMPKSANGVVGQTMPGPNGTFAIVLGDGTTVPTDSVVKMQSKTNGRVLWERPAGTAPVAQATPAATAPVAPQVAAQAPQIQPAQQAQPTATAPVAAAPAGPVLTDDVVEIVAGGPPAPAVEETVKAATDAVSAPTVVETVAEPTKAIAGKTLDDMPLWQGKAWRSDADYQHGRTDTVGDVVRHETDELGNDIGVDPAVLPDLDKISARGNVWWVAKTKKVAATYGPASEWPLSGDWRVVGEDRQGGYLVVRKALAEPPRQWPPSPALADDVAKTAPTSPAASIAEEVAGAMPAETIAKEAIEVAPSPVVADEVVKVSDEVLATPDEVVEAAQEVPEVLTPAVKTELAEKALEEIPVAPKPAAETVTSVQKMLAEWQNVAGAKFKMDEAMGFVYFLERRARVLGYTIDEYIEKKLGGIVKADKATAEDALKRAGRGSGKMPNAWVEPDKATGKAIISIFEYEGVVDLVHEWGHIFRGELNPTQLKVANDWAGVVGNVWTEAAEEKFADGFMLYLQTGQAPKGAPPEMVNIYKRFTEWLRDAALALKDWVKQTNGKPIRISAPMRDVYDSLFVTNLSYRPDMPPKVRKNAAAPKAPAEARPKVVKTVKESKAPAAEAPARAETAKRNRKVTGEDAESLTGEETDFVYNIPNTWSPSRDATGYVNMLPGGYILEAEEVRKGDVPQSAIEEMKRRILAGNTTPPRMVFVLDEATGAPTLVEQDGFVRALAAQEIGIKEMPVEIVVKKADGTVLERDAAESVLKSLGSPLPSDFRRDIAWNNLIEFNAMRRNAEWAARKARAGGMTQKAMGHEQAAAELKPKWEDAARRAGYDLPYDTNVPIRKPGQAMPAELEVPVAKAEAGAEQATSVAATTDGVIEEAAQPFEKLDIKPTDTELAKEAGVEQKAVSVAPATEKVPEPPKRQSISGKLEQYFIALESRDITPERMLADAEKLSGEKRALAERTAKQYAEWLDDAADEVDETLELSAEARPHFRMAPGAQQETPAFKQWFGDSKVVDDSGQPTILYHGTAKSFDAFDMSRLGTNTAHPTAKLGVYMTSEPGVTSFFNSAFNEAKNDWGPRQGANVMPLYASIKKPFEMTAEDFMGQVTKATVDEIAEFKRSLIDDGFDGIHVLPRAGRFGAEHAGHNWIAFEPGQVKSALGNQGTYDLNNQSILFRRKEATGAAPHRGPGKKATQVPTPAQATSAVPPAAPAQAAPAPSAAAQAATPPPAQAAATTGNVVTDSAKAGLDFTNRFLDQLKAEVNTYMATPVQGAISQVQREALTKYINSITGDLMQARGAALKMAEWFRDMSLLPYDQKRNYNNWLGLVVPFEMWPTTSMRNWAMRAAENPGWAPMYAKYKQKLEETQNEPGFPARFRGMAQIDLPFVPEWMGSQFFDPLSRFLPLDQWATPIEMAQYEGNNGLAELGLGYLSPHVPISWIIKFATGNEQEIGTLWPGTRQIRTFSVLFSEAFPEIAKKFEGVPVLGDMNKPGGIELEAFYRTRLGLSPSDVWDAYRTDRMLANMAADGDITKDEAIQAMRERKGEAYDLALRRATLEAAFTTFSPMMLMNVRTYPGGEKKLRAEQVNLDDLVNRVFLANGGQEGQDKWAFLKEKKLTGSGTEIGKWFDDHPEYSARIEARKSVEQRAASIAKEEVYAQKDTNYEVLTHMPKTYKDTLSAADKAALDKFYGAKGDLTKLTPAEQSRIAAMVDEASKLAPEKTMTELLSEMPEEYASKLSAYDRDLVARYVAKQVTWDSLSKADQQKLGRIQGDLRKLAGYEDTPYKATTNGAAGKASSGSGSTGTSKGSSYSSGFDWKYTGRGGGGGGGGGRGYTSSGSGSTNKYGWGNIRGQSEPRTFEMATQIVQGKRSIGSLSASELQALEDMKARLGFKGTMEEFIAYLRRNYEAGSPGPNRH